MEELIKQAKKGDKKAFTDLILWIKHDLYKIAKMRLTREADIEDAVQETMLEAFRSIKKLKKIESFKTWTIKILINKCNKLYRKKESIKLIEDYDTENDIFSECKDIEENNIDFYLLIKCLAYEERMIITLYYLEDYSIKMISKALKIKENTVKTKLVRAREKIKTEIMRRELA